MVDGIETVFENGRPIEPKDPAPGPTLREEIVASHIRSKAEAARGTALFAQQDAAFREQQSTGRIEIEEVPRIGGPAVVGTASIELI